MKRSERFEPQPLNVERVLSGEAYVVVSLPDGRWVLGTIVDREAMYVPSDVYTTKGRTDAANRGRQTQHVNAMALVLDLTEASPRPSDEDIAAALIKRDLMRADPVDPIRRVKTLRAQARRFFEG